MSVSSSPQLSSTAFTAMSDVHEQPLVSIVMPTFNRAALMCEAIASVLAQSYANWELLIADDGSTDDTAERVRSFQDPRIRYFAQPHSGRAAVMRNHALAQARGLLIAFLDSDDLWRPFKLETQVQFFQAWPKIGFLYTRTEVFDENGLLEVRPRGVTAPTGQVFWKLALGNFVSSNTVMMRVNVIHDVGFQSERFGISEDYEHWLRVAQRYEFGFLPEISAAYRRHAGNVSADLLREAIRGRDAVLPILDTVSGHGWQRLLARWVAQARVLAVAANDAAIDDDRYSELLAQRRSNAFIRVSAPWLRRLFRALLQHRAVIERLATTVVSGGFKRQ